MEYTIGRNNLAITIFVPYDCGNNCSFCTSKKDYLNNKDFSLDKIINSLKRIGGLSFIKDIVITGGEPFADLKQLQKLLNICYCTHKNIYINTTLPVHNETEKQKILKFIKLNKDNISGLNVSRHIVWKNQFEDDSMLYEIMTYGIPIKINSVLFGWDDDKEKSLISAAKLTNFVNKYSNYSTEISFRADYTNIIDKNDLKEFDAFATLIATETNYKYLYSGGCLVCNDDVFQGPDGVKIHYHRGTEFSSIKFGNNYIINDIVIKQNGKILLDWDERFPDCNIDNLLLQETPEDVDYTEFNSKNSLAKPSLSKEQLFRRHQTLYKNTGNYRYNHSDYPSSGGCGGSCGSGGC